MESCIASIPKFPNRLLGNYAKGSWLKKHCKTLGRFILITAMLKSIRFLITERNVRGSRETLGNTGQEISLKSRSITSFDQANYAPRTITNTGQFRINGPKRCEETALSKRHLQSVKECENAVKFHIFLFFFHTTINQFAKSIDQIRSNGLQCHAASLFSAWCSRCESKISACWTGRKNPPTMTTMKFTLRIEWTMVPSLNQSRSFSIRMEAARIRRYKDAATSGILRNDPAPPDSNLVMRWLAFGDTCPASKEQSHREARTVQRVRSIFRPRGRVSDCRRLKFITRSSSAREPERASPSLP